MHVANGVRGDVRRGIGLLENAYFAAGGTDDGETVWISKENVDDFYVRVGNFNDDTHFDLLSCLQKSIRGSDPDATAFYVGKLVAAGELISLCRRLQVIASEDVGLAYPQAAAIVRALPTVSGVIRRRLSGLWPPSHRARSSGSMRSAWAK